MSRFVRSSKYRHVFGRPTRKEQCYDNLHISKNAWDSNIVKANPKYLSVNWESSGGGSFAVLPLTHRGRLPEHIPLFRGHTATVLDTDWSPFNDSLVASGSDDGKVFIWSVPEDFTLHSEDDGAPKDVSPVNRLAGHSRKVGHVLFHPSAESVLATSSGDFTVKLWDIETGQARLTQTHSDIVQSLSFSGNGSLLVTTCRDKKLRIWDLRQEKAVHEVQGHSGAKNSRAVWMGELDRIATTGFSKMSDRQLGLWDLRSISEPKGGFQMLDSISGVCMPFWDDGTKCLFLAGKGDGNIRYYEYVNDEFVYLSEYKSADPQRGVAFLPRRGLAVHENEISRAYKAVSDSYVEPISFIVPRRAETFQSDIYPEAPSGEAGLSAQEWFGGKDAYPPKFDLASLYSDESSGASPSVTISSPVHTRKPSEASMAQPSVSSTSKMSSSSHRDAIPEQAKVLPSSLDASTKPEPPATKTMGRVPVSPATATKSSFDDGAVIAPATSPENDIGPMGKLADSKSVAQGGIYSQTVTNTTKDTGSGRSSIEDQLGHISTLLEAHSSALATQSERVSQLAEMVATLAGKIEEMKAKDEIIRKLEIQLEEARS